MLKDFNTVLIQNELDYHQVPDLINIISRY